MTGPEPTRRLDEYLDGVLEGSERAEAARWIAEDPRAGAEARAQARIDESLKRLFAPGAAGAAGAPAGAAEPGVARAGTPRALRLNRRVVVLAVAAAAAVLLAVSAVVLAPMLEPRPDRLGEIYHAQLASGFVPEEVCTSREEFAGWLSKNYGEALYPATDPAVELVGWSYGRAVSNYSGVLLARVEGRPVVVVVDRAEKEGRRLAAPGDESLRMFRSRVGNLVLYEVTPLAGARVVPLLTEGAGGGG